MEGGYLVCVWRGATGCVQHPHPLAWRSIQADPVPCGVLVQESRSSSAPQRRASSIDGQSQSIGNPIAGTVGVHLD